MLIGRGKMNKNKIDVIQFVLESNFIYKPDSIIVDKEYIKTILEVELSKYFVLPTVYLYQLSETIDRYFVLITFGNTQNRAKLYGYMYIAGTNHLELSIVQGTADDIYMEQIPVDDFVFDKTKKKTAHNIYKKQKV